MDALSVLLDRLKKGQKIRGHFLGLLYVLIGRRITAADGSLVSTGLSWRSLASWLKKIRWDPDTVTELGLRPEELSPRDREQYWFQAITRAHVDSAKARADAEQVTEILADMGYTVSGGPSEKSKKP